MHGMCQEYAGQIDKTNRFLIGESGPGCDFGAKNHPTARGAIRRSCKNGELPAKTRLKARRLKILLP